MPCSMGHFLFRWDSNASCITVFAVVCPILTFFSLFFFLFWKVILWPTWMPIFLSFLLNACIRKSISINLAANNNSLFESYSLSRNHALIKMTKDRYQGEYNTFRSHIFTRLCVFIPVGQYFYVFIFVPDEQPIFVLNIQL